MMFIEARRKRLRDLAGQRTLFADIFDFYAHLYDFFAGERETFLTVTPDGGNREMQQREGFPLLSGDCLAVDAAKAGAFLGRLIEVLRKHGREGSEDLGAFRKALANSDLDLSFLFRAALERDRRPLSAAAETAGIQPAILEYVITTALGFALQHCREEGVTVETSGWEQGYCPLCGGLPVMGELAGEEGKKMLHCGTCGTSWAHTRLQCSHCGNDDLETLEYFTVGGDSKYRVNVCRKCSCYLKLVDSREAGEGLPLDIEDIATLHLDLLAQKEGFTRGKLGREA